MMVSVSTTPGSETSAATESARDDRLVSVLSRARGRSFLGVSEGLLFALGGALAIGGIVLVIVGWVGTSQTILVAGQIPYVVSGGLLGLALVFLGGFLYFGYWLALLFRDRRARGERQELVLARVAEGLEAANDTLASITEVLVADHRRRGRGTRR